MKHTDLPELIRSLSPAEKGYFKKYAQLHGASSKSYLKLFDAINAQAEYDEEKLKKKLGSTLSNFSAAKSYLYEMLLDAMREFHSNKSPTGQLHKLIERFDFLYEKGLYEQALDTATETEKLAAQEGKFEQALVIGHRKTHLLLDRQDFSGLQEFLAEDDQRQNEYLHHLARRRQFMPTYLKTCLLILQRQSSLDAAEANALKAELQTTFEQWDVSADDRELQLTFYNAYGHFCRMTHQRAKGLWCKNKVLEVMRTLPHTTTESIDNYIVALNDAYVSYSDFYQLPEATALQDEMRTLLGNKHLQHSPQLKLKLEQRLYMGELLLNMRWGNFTAVNELLQQHSDWLQQNENQLNTVYRCELMIARMVSSFVQKKYAPALLAIQQLLCHSPPQTHRRNKVAARVLWLVIQFETEDWHTLGTQLRNTYKHLLQLDYANPEMLAALDFLKHHARHGNTQLKHNDWRALREKLTAAEAQGGISPFGLFNFYAWLESKINSTAFADEVQKAAQAKQQSFAAGLAAEEFTNVAA